MPKDCEIEFKFALEPGAAAAFRKLALLRENGVGSPLRRKVFCVYFDTPALALRQRGMALRLRKVNGKWQQTLKTAGVMTGGLQERGEWEMAMPGCQLDLARFADTPLATLPGKHELHLALAPAFTTEFHRTAWLIETAPGERVEVAMDQGLVRCGDHTSVISEVEIELIEGSVAGVFDIALAILQQIELRPQTQSKAERGYQLLAPQPCEPQRARTTALKRKWSTHEAMRATFVNCIDHVEANVAGAISSDDIEYVHQLRVALRRLRSAIRIFGPAHAEKIDAELKWLAGQLRAARDWDVLIAETLPALLSAYGDQPSTAALVRAATMQKADARVVARAALESKRAGILRVTLARWVNVPGELIFPVSEEGEADAQTQETQRLSRFAAHKIGRAYRRLTGVNGTVSALSAEARHRVRIDAKKLRYAVDFLGSLFDKKRTARHTAILGKIQDLLGETNDGVVAMRLLASLAPPAPFIDFARGWFAARTRGALGEVDCHFAKLKKMKRL